MAEEMEIVDIDCLLFILIWGIIGIAFFCIGIGLHARGREKEVSARDR